MTTPVRVRFAPSPTGALHIGGAHTALFNWLWARHSGGSFVLRVEDTDRERSTTEYEKTIIEGMRWLGLDWDEGPYTGGDHGPYRQSERQEIYHRYAEQLVAEGKAYREGPAVIYRVPRGERITVEDKVYGDIDFESDTLKDIVLIKSDGSPTYNYAVVVDDYTMNITYVIRGEDHVLNTPKQILLYRALDWRLPVFAHLPMILGPDKKKLSKRHGATSVYEYRDMGYLPDAIFNFLALLGWSPGGEREIFTRDEIAERFELSRIAKRPAVFDTKKLDAINQEHLKGLPRFERLEMVKPFWEKMGLPLEGKNEEHLADGLELMEGRGRTLPELAAYSDYFLDFGVVTERYSGEDIDEEQREEIRPFFAELLQLEEWSAQAMEDFARTWAREHGVKLKRIAMPMRWALTGRKVSPGIFNLAEHFGREETRRRLAHYDLV
ncbi:MAG: glutamate--tRNA ligase [Synergistales bacterium]|nr:glutamate--tRNA ligase [Synergistales bacterium]